MSGVQIPGGCAAIIPAGGRAERLGGVPKPLLAGPDGVSPLARTLAHLEALGVGPVIVVAAAPDVAGSSVVTDSGATVVPEDPPFSGPAAAVAAGLRMLEPRGHTDHEAAAARVLVLPADLPDVAPGITVLADAVTAALEAGAESDSALPELFLGTVAGRDQRMFALVDTAALAARARARESWADAPLRALYADLRTARIELPADQAADIDDWAQAARLGHDSAWAPTWQPAMAIARAVGAAVADSGPDRLPESVPLERAAGRVAAVDVVAADAIPHYASSAMDGYVVAESATARWRLEAGPAEPGTAAHTASGLGVLAPGTARPVLTGGALPAGTWGVIRQEYASVAGGVLAPAPGTPDSELDAGRHVRAAGREAGAGTVVVPAGTALTPAHVAYLTLAGIDEVAVRTRPAVGLVFTGDEVVEAGRPGPGRVRDSFGPVLPGVLASWGAEVVAAERVPDDYAALRDAVDRQLALGARLVLTTGGTGHSSADHVRSLLERRFAETGTGCVAIPHVRMRPGHPTMLGLLAGSAEARTAEPGDSTGGGMGDPQLAALVALPGNPLAAMTALRIVARPVFEGIVGCEPTLPWAGTLEQPVGPGRADVVMPVRRLPDGRWEPSGPGGSAMLSGLAAADGLAVIPRDGTGESGTVQVLSLPWPT